MLRLRNTFFFWILALLLGPVIPLAQMQAAPPPPGTIISGQADLTYVDPNTFVTSRLWSNIVKVLVTGFADLDLQADRTATVTPGSWFALPHILTNPGTIAGTYTLTPSLISGGAFAVQNLSIVVDTNGNGVVDTGEPSLPFTPQTFTLLPGQELRVLLVGQVAFAATAGSTQLGLEASLNGSALSATNTDTVTLSTGALILTKSVDRATAARGDKLLYTLTGTNTYPVPLAPDSVTIDGGATTAVLLRDPLPADTEFDAFVSPSASTPQLRLLYHSRADADPMRFTTGLPAGGAAMVDAVAFALPQLASGDSFSASFRVKVGDSASGALNNTAYLGGQINGASQVQNSNVVTTTIPFKPPAIGYYDPTFTKPVLTAPAGGKLYVGVDAGSCATLGTYPPAPERRMITVILASRDTQDGESYTAIETGHNTGFYVINTSPTLMTAYDPAYDFVPTQNRSTPTLADGILQTIPRDTITAKFTDCGGIEVETRILIDPFGIVFDSRTNAPITGAIVTLQRETGPGVFADATTGVYDFLGNPVPATQTTGPDGRFDYPAVDPGVYRIVVAPPTDYSFPSLIPPGGLPPGRVIHNNSILGGSYGYPFPVNTSTGAVQLDIPLDTAVGNGLVLEKLVNGKPETTAEIGDSVTYTLTLKNSSGAPFNYTFIDDRLPFGFKYLAGTARQDGVAIADPIGGAGPNLRFTIGTLADGAETVFTYRVRLAIGADRGDGINTAQATSYGPPVLTSNNARARVKIEKGVFDPNGVIIGTVFVDANGNDIQDAGEPGVPGVRLILEDGTYAITDIDGQYSIYGQRPITHVLKVDPSTLPPGAKLGGNSPRFGKDPGSRFVDLKKFELHKANFLLVEPTEELLAAVEARREQAKSWQPEIETALTTNFTVDGSPTLTSDLKSLPAAGVVGSGNSLGEANGFNAVLPEGTLTSGNSSLPPSPVAAVPLVPLENLLTGLTDPAPDFIGLKDGDTLPSSQQTIRIKGALEARLQLLINGKPASESRIGKTVQQAAPPLQAVEYVSMLLNPGENKLEIVQSDLFGNERDRKAITVIAPDQLARFEVSFSTLEPKADGHTPVEVHVRAVDAKGVPVSAGMPLTLESTLGRWDVEDVNPREPGVQVSFQNGQGTYRLVPPIEPGTARIVVSSGALKGEKKVDFLPDLRPMVAAGIIEGRFALSRLKSGQLMPVSPSDAFEEELRSNAGIGGDGTGSGRAAFYLKGKIKGDALLTVAYDSDKKRDDVKLFRDIDPDAYYPVYGDSSVKGYDAQSTGKLYVRIDKDRSYFLLGDYNTRSESDARELGNYNRSLNGVRVEHETARFKGGLWASDDSTEQVIREIPANGTSGPYNFQAGTGLLGSETVEILVRDRNQRSVILTTTTLVRNVDYDFEPFTGRILLRRPLPSVDSNFNPQSLRITYEVDTNGPRFWVYGGDAQVKPFERFEVGGSFARDENPTDPYDLQSVNATLDLGYGTYLIAEGAHSNSIVTPGAAREDGYAWRVDLRHQSANTEARVFYGETDPTFANDSSQLDKGRAEGGAKLTQKLTNRTQLVGEAVYTADQSGVGQREGARVDVVHTLPNQVKVTIGGRVSEETVTPANADATAPGVAASTPVSVRSARIRVDTPVPKAPHANVFAEYEQDVVEADQRMVALGGDYQVSTKTRLYARHEILSTLGSPFELNSSQQNNRTVVGVESEYLKDAHAFNEYRVRSDIDGGGSEASTGLRNLWNVSEGFRLNTTFERVTPIDGATSNQSTSATIGYDYTKPVDWKSTGRLEARWADTTDGYLSTLGYARKINEQWTFLGRTMVNLQFNDTAGTADLFQGRVLTGLAWRQAPEDVWNALFRYEYKFEQGSTDLGDPSMTRQVHTLAASVNYQPDKRWIFSGHYATKFVQERYGSGPDGDYFGHLLAGRILYEVNSRWDIGLNLAVNFDDAFGNNQWAIGPEIGRIFNKNVRIGLGYNITGFHDRDFSTADTSRGLFLSLRIKFDENLLKWARFD